MFFNRKKNWLYARIQLSAEKPATVKWMIKSKIVRTEGQANVLLILLVVATLWLAVSVYPYKQNTLPEELLLAQPPGFNEEIIPE